MPLGKMASSGFKAADADEQKRPTKSGYLNGFTALIPQ